MNNNTSDSTVAYQRQDHVLEIFVDSCANLQAEVLRLQNENKKLRDVLEPLANVGRLFLATSPHDAALYLPAAGKQYMLTSAHAMAAAIAIDSR